MSNRSINMESRNLNPMTKSIESDANQYFTNVSSPKIQNYKTVKSPKKQMKSNRSHGALTSVDMSKPVGNEYGNFNRMEITEIIKEKPPIFKKRKVKKQKHSRATSQYPEQFNLGLGTNLLPSIRNDKVYRKVFDTYINQSDLNRTESTQPSRKRVHHKRSKTNTALRPFVTGSIRSELEEMDREIDIEQETDDIKIQNPKLTNAEPNLEIKIDDHKE